MIKERASGILLHPTSLPGPYGIGTLGASAIRFIDFLAKAKQKYWQILPLGPTGYADSPYQCFSAHAGNPNLIDPDQLLADKLITKADITGLPSFPDGPVDYDKVQESRVPIFRKAFETFNKTAGQMEKMKYRNFLKDQSGWINDYALFMAIKAHSGHRPWYKWSEALKKREPAALKEQQVKLHDEAEYHKFLQYIFFRQWFRVRDHAHKLGIRIIGDIPLYVSLDSADAWASPEFFEFDEKRNPIRVGGVPPDYFSETGQLWGNPLYRWDKMQETGYSWWIDRIRTNLFLYDVIRIDHFRGFAGYWAIPYGEKTAVKGKWVPGPGKDFFRVIGEKMGDLPIIAEDLGVITDDVEDLRDSFAFPGMKILQFAFDSSEANDYLPHNYPKNCIVYTGTHDNDTVAGWFKAASEPDREYVLEYMNTKGEDIAWDFVRLAWASVAYTAIAPVQDLLGLGTESRMNFPGTTKHNWQWRAPDKAFSNELADRLAHLTLLYGRAKPVKKH